MGGKSFEPGAVVAAAKAAVTDWRVLLVGVAAAIGEGWVIVHYVGDRCDYCSLWIVSFALLGVTPVVGFAVGLIAAVVLRARAGLIAASAGAALGATIEFSVYLPDHGLFHNAFEGLFLGLWMLVGYAASAVPLGGLIWLSRRLIRTHGPASLHRSADQSAREPDKDNG